jgi:DNA repair exonuclease SbcCD ATPase subunit
MNAKELAKRTERLKGRRDGYIVSLNNLRKDIKRRDRRLGNIDKARAVLRTVAKQTQEQLRYHITEIVSLALEAVFDEPYDFQVVFEERRGKTECDLVFLLDGEPIHPMSASGGGPIDVAAFALRIALWTLARPRPRPILVLDEPFRFLSIDLQPKASEMLAEVSHKLGLQVLVITHSPILAESADRTFTVSQLKGKTTITSSELLSKE